MPRDNPKAISSWERKIPDDIRTAVWEIFFNNYFASKGDANKCHPISEYLALSPVTSKDILPCLRDRRLSIEMSEVPNLLEKCRGLEHYPSHRIGRIILIWDLEFDDITRRVGNSAPRNRRRGREKDAEVLEKLTTLGRVGHLKEVQNSRPRAQQLRYHTKRWGFCERRSPRRAKEKRGVSASVPTFNTQDPPPQLTAPNENKTNDYTAPSLCGIPLSLPTSDTQDLPPDLTTVNGDEADKRTEPINLQGSQVVASTPGTLPAISPSADLPTSPLCQQTLEGPPSKFAFCIFRFYV
ncbi:hypothetical protein TWF481_002580 [Arthrobotrys musiformis]|uniref:Uncharacterized protein n=1 Tax=Arthrobotrys musiformis TaxID=47236 RepID=A0AAV9VT39_9PEZI